MKKAAYLFLCLIVFVLASCQKDDEAISPEASILGVQMSSNGSVSQAQKIEVTIKKPTPCHQVKEVNVASSGMSVDYDIIIQDGGQICTQVIAEEVVAVNFEPQQSGEYTLNFLINGKLYETRKVLVTN